MPQSTPRQLGKYKILEEIGRGGFATVYKAEDATLGRTVALKVLDPLLLRDPTFMERFRLEARTAANLYHPNIVAIHEMGESEGSFYLAMQYVDGPHLNERLSGEALPLREMAAIVAGVASALDYAHGQGLVHRDVKPSNILLDRSGRAYLSDFGIVKALENTQVMTSRGGILGTPEYMSPEQAESLELDGRSDVYSLGVVAYHMCTGQVPFQGATPTSVHYKHVHEPPPRPSSLHPQAAGPVEDVLLKALAKKPGDRYPTAGEFARALDGVVAQVETAWLRAQLTEAETWIDQGHHQRAIEHLEKLAQVHSGDREISELLAKARRQAQLADLYGEVQQLWTQAKVKAEELAAAAPTYDDPDGLLARFRQRPPEPEPEPAPVPATEPEVHTAEVITAALADCSSDWPKESGRKW
jgi:serine/threonine protein kinase